MKIKLINVGRNQVNRGIEMDKPTWGKIVKEVKKHLASKYFDIDESEDANNFNITAGYRPVGKIWVENPELLK